MKKSLFIALLALIFIFLFVVFSEPVLAGEWANSGQTCTEYCASTGKRLCIDTQNTVGDRITVGSSCSSSNPPLSCNRVYPYQLCCTCLDASTLTSTPTPTPSGCNGLNQYACGSNSDAFNCVWDGDFGGCLNAPTPTPTPTQSLTNFNCGNRNCSSNDTCVGTSFDTQTFCLTKGAGVVESYCGTPNKSPNSEACSSGFCDSTLHCASRPRLVWKQIACPVPTATSTSAFTSSNPTPTPTQAPQRGSPTPTPTPKPLLSITNVTTKLLGDGYVEATASLNKDVFSCLSMECSYKDGKSSTPVVASTYCMNRDQRPAANVVVNSSFKPTQSNQWSLLSCKINTIPPSPEPLATYTNAFSLDTPTPTPSPTQATQRGSPTSTPTQPPAGPAATTPNLFACENQTGIYAGKYTCAYILNTTPQCPEGYSPFKEISPYTGTDCEATRGCCKKDPSVSTPTATSTITPTPAPVNKATLVLTLNAQDIPLSPDPLLVSLILYNLTTNDPVTGAPARKSFARTPIPGKHYSANIPLTSLPSDKYFIVARRDNMIAKSLFTATGETGNITVPTTTLVFGDINKDNDINALDYHLLISCYKKTIVSAPTCESSDFDKNEVINQIDFNTLLRGWATWNKEGKEIQ